MNNTFGFCNGYLIYVTPGLRWRTDPSKSVMDPVKGGSAIITDALHICSKYRVMAEKEWQELSNSSDDYTDDPPRPSFFSPFLFMRRIATDTSQHLTPTISLPRGMNVTISDPLGDPSF